MGAKSNLMSRLETALDENEDYIGSKPWKDLESAYDDLDKEALELEKELVDSDERIQELERLLEEANDKIAELEADR